VKTTIITNNKNQNMKKHAKIASVVVVLGGLMLTTSVMGQYYTSGPPTFPEGWYVGPPQPFTFEGPELTAAGISSIDLSGLVHTPGQIISDVYNPNPPNNPPYWQETFYSTLTGTATINWLGGGSTVGTLSAGGTTPVTVDIFGNYNPGATGSAANGSWNTSMTILDWPATVTGVAGTIWLQCLDATGVTTVTNLTVPHGAIPAGWYQATSFFDVQPEISLDNEDDWITADQSGDMTLTTPEPSSLALLGIGAVSLLAREWRRRTAKA
jgi:hypothetical protein